MNELNQNSINSRQKPKVPLVLFIISILILIGVGGYFVYAKKLMQNHTEVNSDSTEQIDVTKNNIFENNLFSYKLSEVDITNPNKYDQQVIKVNDQTKEEEVVIKSVKNEIPELNDRFNRILEIFAEPKNSDLIFFKSLLDGTEVIYGKLYSFNVKAKNFNSMNINNIIGEFAFNYQLSEDKTKFTYIKDPATDRKSQQLFLVDLPSDDAKLLVQLDNNETFVKEFNSFGAKTNVKWLDEQTITYSVFTHLENPKVDPVDASVYLNNFLEERIKQIN